MNRKQPNPTQAAMLTAARFREVACFIEAVAPLLDSSLVSSNGHGSSGHAASPSPPAATPTKSSTKSSRLRRNNPRNLTSVAPPAPGLASGSVAAGGPKLSRKEKKA